MAHSQRVREDDVRVMLRLMGEVGELPSGGTARTRHLLRGIAGLTGSDAAWTTRFRSRGRGRGIEPYAALTTGWTDAETAEAIRIAGDDPLHDRIHDDMCDGIDDAGGRFTGHVHVTDRLDAAAARRRAGARERLVRGTGGDMDVVVLRPAGRPGHVASLGVSRHGNAKRPLGRREVQIAALLWDAAAGLHRRPLSAFEQRLWGTRLPPRTAQVLDRLRAGLSAKEVAAALGIGVHTVNDHVKVLHARFGVSSRGELMALLANAR